MKPAGVVAIEVRWLMMVLVEVLVVMVVPVLVLRMVDPVLATAITMMLTLRMTFLTTVIFVTEVPVEVGTLLTDSSPRLVEQTTVLEAART